MSRKLNPSVLEQKLAERVGVNAKTYLEARLYECVSMLDDLDTFERTGARPDWLTPTGNSSTSEAKASMSEILDYRAQLMEDAERLAIKLLPFHAPTLKAVDVRADVKGKITLQITEDEADL